MPELFLGLDVGTQSTKGLLVEAERGVVIARAAKAYDLLEGLPRGACEQHPETWVSAIREVCAELATNASLRDVVAIGVSGQQHGLVVLDGAGAVVRPAKLWCDTTTVQEARELSEEFGHYVPCGFTAPKIRWMQRNEPDLWRRVRRVLLPHDYINFKLTGSFSMEAGDASGTGFFDPVTRRFGSAWIDRLDPCLLDFLPALIEAGTPAGRLSADGAALTGCDVGTCVSAGGGDNMMSALGSGATRPGVFVVSLGTSGTVFTHSKKPVVDQSGLIAPFCDSTGGWLPLLCIMNATGVTEEVRCAFGGDIAKLTAEAQQVPAGSEGLLFVPFLQGERVPDLPGATGSILGLRPGTLTGGHLFRAAMEGVTFNLAWGMERFERLGVSVERLRVVGGGARNALWRQILADVSGVEVSMLSEADSAALGAALHAAWTWRRERGESVSADQIAAPAVRLLGSAVEPDPERHAQYRDHAARFQDAVNALFP